MKVAIPKIQTGVSRYIDAEMINHLEGWQKIAFGAGSALILKNLPAIISQYMAHPFVQMLGVIDADGNVEIDALHDAVADYFTQEGEYVDIPLFGRVKFTRSDLEALYKYIKEA